MPTVLVLALTLLLGANALAGPTDLASMDWSVKAAPNLTANSPPADVIKAFMSRLDGVSGYPPSICYARFADLEHSGSLSLVVSEGDGRACHLFVIDKTAKGFERYAFDLSLGVDGPEIKDLGGNGKLELLVPTDLTGYYGAGYCDARWPVIYAWTGHGYGDVSSHYKSYYEEPLAALKKDIATSETGSAGAQQSAAGTMNGGKAPANSAPFIPPATAKGLGVFGVAPEKHPAQTRNAPESDWSELNCYKAEEAKIVRILGISRSAGMTDAIRWADSDNANDRMFAADILADIGTPQALFL